MRIEEKIKILIVDDHKLIRQGIKSLLLKATNIEIIAETDNGKEALILTQQLKPDLIIADISMPVLNGIELTKEIKKKHKKTSILILSTYLDIEHITDAYQAGASGYLSKSATDDQLIAAIEKIAAGSIYYGAEIMSMMSSSFFKKDKIKQANNSLSDREKEILRELVDGHTNKEIAEKYFISVRTVDAHRRNIMKKLEVNNIAQLIKASHDKQLL